VPSLNAKQAGDPIGTLCDVCALLCHDWLAATIDSLPPLR
jgi:hypothetical protein